MPSSFVRIHLTLALAASACLGEPEPSAREDVRADVWSAKLDTLLAQARGPGAVAARRQCQAIEARPFEGDETCRALDPAERSAADRLSTVWGEQPGRLCACAREAGQVHRGCRETWGKGASALYDLAGDSITWTTDVPWLETDGQAIEVVMAHEWGHLVQHRALDHMSLWLEGRWELQADCFAGAYGAIEALRGGPGSAEVVREVFCGPGREYADDSPYGGCAERLSAYVIGFEDGLRAAGSLCGGGDLTKTAPRLCVAIAAPPGRGD